MFGLQVKFKDDATVDALLDMGRTGLEKELAMHRAQAQELAEKEAKLIGRPIGRERELVVKKQRRQTAEGEA